MLGSSTVSPASILLRPSTPSRQSEEPDYVCHHAIVMSSPRMACIWGLDGGNPGLGGDNLRNSIWEPRRDPEPNARMPPRLIEGRDLEYRSVRIEPTDNRLSGRARHGVFASEPDQTPKTGLCSRPRASTSSIGPGATLRRTYNARKVQQADAGEPKRATFRRCSGHQDGGALKKA